MVGRFNPSIFPGARFGKLTVIERIPRSEAKGGRSRVRCKCDCGNITEPGADCFGKKKPIQSCGCLQFSGLKKYTDAVRAFKKGDKFGRLLILKVRIGKRRNVVCRCDCGQVVKTRGDLLVGGGKKSCGCLNTETRRKRFVKRNKETARYASFSSKYPRTFATWRGMKNRCGNKRQKAYANYGGKGVRVCRWLRKSPWNFLKLLGKRPTRKHTLDRFPIHDGHYCCGQCRQCKRKGWELNVRWATRKEQSLNRGDFNVYVTAFGKTLTKSQWEEITGLSWSCLTRRLRKGWSPEMALTTPDSKGNCYKET